MSVNISASVVKELRDATGAGMMDAKKALVEADGDLEKAKEILRQKGIATADKKSGRIAAEGAIGALVQPDCKTGALFEVNSETDFVAKTDEFKQLVKDIANHIIIKKPEFVSKEEAQEAGKPLSNDCLLEQLFYDRPIKVADLVTEKIAKIGENIKIRRFTIYELDGPGLIGSYVHFNSKIGVLLEVTTNNSSIDANSEFKELVKDLCLHIASQNPEFVSQDEVSKDYIENEKRIELGKEDLIGKPEAIKEKIVSGRVEKLIASKCLLKQPFVKDTEKTIDQLVKEKAGSLGCNIVVKRFTRYELGEGIEKRKENFADEVQAQMIGKI